MTKRKFVASKKKRKRHVQTTERMTRLPTGDDKLPDIYRSLDVRSGFDPLDPEFAQILLLAGQRSGKSTFVRSIPRSLTLDTEGGADTVVGARGEYARIRSWTDYVALKDVCIEEANAGHQFFTTINFDTMDFFQELADKELARQYGCDRITDYGSKGAGYFLLRDFIVKEILDWDEAGYGRVLVCHVDEDPVYDAKGNKTGYELKPGPYPTIYKMLRKMSPLILDIERDITAEYPTKEKTTKKGKVLQIPDRSKKPIITKNFLLCCSGISMGDSAKESMVGGCRLPDVEDVILPEVDGWATFRKAYMDAIKRGYDRQVAFDS